MTDAAKKDEQAIDQASELESAVNHAIEACGGNLRDTVRALVVANGLLEKELADVYARASHG
jgi:hypothetical protein